MIRLGRGFGVVSCVFDLRLLVYRVDCGDADVRV